MARNKRARRRKVAKKLAMSPLLPSLAAKANGTHKRRHDFSMAAKHPWNQASAVKKSTLDLVPRRVARLAATVSRELNIPFPQSAQREVRSYLVATIEASNKRSNKQRQKQPRSARR